MEVLRRIARAERALRAVAQLEDLELTQHVGAGLAGEDHVALDLARPDAVGDGLLARPVLGVDAGVDHEAPRAEELGIELPEEALRVAFVPARFRREPLRIKRP